VNAKAHHSDARRPCSTLPVWVTLSVGERARSLAGQGRACRGRRLARPVGPTRTGWRFVRRNQTLSQGEGRIAPERLCVGVANRIARLQLGSIHIHLPRSPQPNRETCVGNIVGTTLTIYSYDARSV